MIDVALALENCSSIKCVPTVPTVPTCSINVFYFLPSFKHVLLLVRTTIENGVGVGTVGTPIFSMTSK